MPRHIFNIVCSEDTVGNNSRYKRIKLVENKDDEEKTVKFCGPYFGAYSIRERDGKEIFELWVEKAKYKLRGDDFCDSWTDGELYQKKDIPLNKVKLKVILDEDCEYKIAVSVEDSQWITLPKSSLFGENLNLKKYYNRELSLLRGENFSSLSNGKYYIPKVMYGQIKICELAPFSFPNCDRGQAELEGFSYPWVSVKNNKIVVEKNGEGELLIYFADGDGIRSTNINGGTKNIVDYANSVLKAVLLENSNIREVLPELDDSVNLDKRKLNCLISKMHNADLAQVAQELVTNKKDELGKAVLEAKDSDQEILVNSSVLQEGVAKKLRENPGNAKGLKGDKGEDGKDGESPSADAVAT
ncbi:MAG: hypothetical protein ACR5K6_01510 [Wolbachia sp.]